MKYLAFDIGCIECGEKSRVIGVFDTRKKAQNSADKAEKIQRENWEGQHYFEVFELPI